MTSTPAGAPATLSPSRRWPSLPWALLLTAHVAVAYTPPRKFLIVSQGGSGAISYTVLPEEPSGPRKMWTLIAAGDGLRHPQGIAVDQKRGLLFVADSGIEKVVSYGLTSSGDSLWVDEQTPVVEDVDSRWVAVDGMGNVYFTDELGNRILRVTGEAAKTGTAKAETLLQQETISSLSAPGGIATDNHYLYWTNKDGGVAKGSVVRALQAINGSTDLANASNKELKLKALEHNTEKSYGVCVAMGQAFYTDTESTIWGMRKTGEGGAVKVNASLTNPRGCAWDGFNTLYVADRGAHAVYALTAPMVSLAETEVTKVAELQEAFGVAIFSGAPRRPARAALLLSLLLGLLPVGLTLPASAAAVTGPDARAAVRRLR